MSALPDLHFLRPLWLLAILLLPLPWLLWRRLHAAGGAWRAAVDAHLLPHLLDRRGPSRRTGAAWLFGALWIVLCVAAAGPAWERDAMPLMRNQAARVFALELAPTMLASDLKPDRLSRARYKLEDLLRASRDQQTALIGYAGDAFVAAPLTDDANTVRNLVDALSPNVMPLPGNATARAIEQAHKLLAQAGVERGELIVLADGVGGAALQAARRAHAEGLTISVLGVGTEAGAPVPLPQGGFLQDAGGNLMLPRLDEPALRALAEAGGGHYARLAADGSDIERLLAAAPTSANARAVDESVDSERWRDRGPWLVLLALPLALLVFRRGWVFALAWCFILPSPSAQAFSFADLWLRPDQQAARALAAGDPARAQALAEDPAWRGSAAYRGSDYAGAADAFAAAPGADAAYNHGNALAQAGRYEDALAAYDRALALDPALPDARENRAKVEQALKQRQAQDQARQGGQKNDGQQGDRPRGDQDQKKDGQQQDSQQQDSQQQDGQQQQDQPQDGQQRQDGQQQQGQQQDDQPQKASSKDDGPKDGDKRDGDAEPSPSTDADAQQRKALSNALDQALADPNAPRDGETAPTAAPLDEAQREQNQALEHWLQRVPDDPGGLLRRKFQLEYERRQRAAGGGR